MPSFHYGALFLAFVALFATALVRTREATADEGLSKEQIAKLVLDKFRENYAPVTTIQATVKTVLGSVK